jgi:L-alanine-DL-glutamate epimerase-like enolase superfamily enzyme
LHSEEGVHGLGETFWMPRTVEAYLHEWVAPKLVGKTVRSIERTMRELQPYLGARSTGAETRGNSAINIALWDLAGKIEGKPIYELLGGAYRDRIRIYNTCAGPAYMRNAVGQRAENWGLSDGGPYNDLEGFLTRADELAAELLSEGTTAMKIWPFDRAAEATDGLHISSDDLKTALEPFDKIRSAVGQSMDILVEFHSLWTLTPAMRLARELARFDTYWHEDPIKMENLSDLRRYSEVSQAPICASETFSASGFRDLIETDVAGVIMPDLGWCGGLSEGRRIAALAETWRLPLAPHDCTGPVVLCAATHLCMSAPNALIQETVRSYYRGWYREVVSALPPIEKGFIAAPPGPGLGLELHPDLRKRFSVSSLTTDATDVRRAS